MNGLRYYFTKYGDVYAGYEFIDANFPSYTIIIEPSKLKDFQALKPDQKTEEKIREHGFIVTKGAIAGYLDSNKFTPPHIRVRSDGWSSSYDRSLMFIFGAGASANCIYGSEQSEFTNDPLRPPLGPNLFDNRFKQLYSNYQGVKQSLTFLRSENPNVEELFENEWKNISLDNNEIISKRHINIQYYVQELLREVTHRVTSHYAMNLYANLANRLQKAYAASKKITFGSATSKKFAFISFNQDTILEYYLTEQFNAQLKSLDDYVNPNETPFCLFKPHGSWNWGWEFPTTTNIQGKTSEWLFNRNTNYFQLYFELLGQGTKMVDWSMWGYEKLLSEHSLGKYSINKSLLKLISNSNLDSYYPSLLLPYRDKDEFSMPLYHLNNLTTYLEGVKTLIIIGWKGNENAFNKLLFKNATKINKIIIADPYPEIVEQNLKPLLPPTVSKVIYNSFEDFVLNGLEKELHETHIANSL